MGGGYIGWSPKSFLRGVMDTPRESEKLWEIGAHTLNGSMKRSDTTSIGDDGGGLTSS